MDCLTAADPWAPDGNSLNEVHGKGRDADDDRNLATVVKMDRTLGNLFDRLKDMGEAENTLIVVTSDNGPSALQRYYKNGATPPGSVLALRGRKGSLYDLNADRRSNLPCFPRGLTAAVPF